MTDNKDNKKDKKSSFEEYNIERKIIELEESYKLEGLILEFFRDIELNSQKIIEIYPEYFESRKFIKDYFLSGLISAMEEIENGIDNLEQKKIEDIKEGIRKIKEIIPNSFEIDNNKYGPN